MLSQPSIHAIPFPIMYIVMFHKYIWYSTVSLVHVVRVLVLTYSLNKLIVGTRELELSIYVFVGE